MAEVTLKSLAARVEVLEQRLAALMSVIPPTQDWQRVIGMFEGSKFMRQVDAEIAAIRAAEPMGDEGIDSTPDRAEPL